MRFSTSCRWMWETCYLFAVYFQLINNASTFTVLGGIWSNNALSGIKKSDMDALFAFGLIANISAWFTIALSTFRRSRALVIPCMIFSTSMFIITMAIETHLFSVSQVSMTEFWQFPLGWAAAIIKVGTCIFVKFWDLNESEDKYTSTGYLGAIPVFQISRCLIYLSLGWVVCACRGFVIAQLIGVNTTQLKAFHIISIVTTIIGFIVTGAVIMKPQKGLCALLSLLCFGLSIGQAIIAHQNYQQNLTLEYPAGTAFSAKFQVQQLEWMTGYAWAGMATYFVAFVMTLARCD